jgi:hypothetical protein
MLGRIDAHTLVAMGYRDCWEYLSIQRDGGTPLDLDATKMHEAPLGIRYRDRSTGSIDDPSGQHSGPVELRMGVELHGVASRGTDAMVAPMVGSIRFGEGPPTYFRDGEVHWEADGAVVHTARCRHDGRGFDLRAVRRFPPDQASSRRLIDGLASVELTLSESGSAPCVGQLRSSISEIGRRLVSIEPSSAHGLGDRVSAVRGLARLVRGQWNASGRRPSASPDDGDGNETGQL